jgi:hypothetical protein
MIDYYETKSQPITKLMVWQAYKEVRSNKGSRGIGIDIDIDIITLEDLEQNKSKALDKLWNRLISGSYFPDPDRQVAIPKQGGVISPLLANNFLGFTVRPSSYKHPERGEVKTIPSIFVSEKSKKSIMEKFITLQIHKKRKTLEELAKALNPIIRGLINYYHKFRKSDMRQVWRQLNLRLLKWVKWEKDLYKQSSIRYLKAKYKESPNLFAHWVLVCP